MDLRIENGLIHSLKADCFNVNFFKSSNNLMSPELESYTVSYAVGEMVIL